MYKIWKPILFAFVWKAYFIQSFFQNKYMLEEGILV